ncbi:DUF1146 domain-containing protein [Paenibacillus prosopidis]|jgi:uncharacterized integral membrane protein (TIGR02327 family)|uniref:Putative integral membrane protein (TIGR02327 family) n=1 Tax=Paenibacillus prosopidis TaxID=630520 RepID=A0A368VT34_9BACL|nr:DUF1146 domain-containing protein [Paenibacillus prosopidis]RCW44860.1 putative integral membrane protein (TIGR02327 family) [Paenibacillus prosopidis]
MNVDNELYNDIQRYTGMTGLFSIVIVILSIIFVWVVLQEVKWETFFRFPRSPKARLFQVLVAIILGNLFAKFILEYWGYTVLLKSFVE